MLAPRLFLTAALAASLAAQAPTLVDATGAAYPQSTVTVGGSTYDMSLVPNGKVFASLNPALATGYYSFVVWDVTFTDKSLLPVEDRIYFAENNGAAGFALTRNSSTAGLPAEGVGFGGVGESMPLSPYMSPGIAGYECVLKCGIYSHGASPTGTPLFVGFQFFQIGDGTPGSVSGVVFRDANQDGDRDAGEPGLSGFSVKLVNTTTSTVVSTTTTNANGEYVFSPLGFDNCSVMLEFMSSMYTATTPVDVALSNCGCGQQSVNFGLYNQVTTCIGRTPGFWQNNNGTALIVNGGFWDELVALNLVNATGAAYDPSGSVAEWRNWLKNRNAVNMAYQLSAHLAAMQLNVLSGSVSGNCWAQTSSGPMNIMALITAANEALGLDPFTPVGDANRAAQELLKNALDAANNNQNWL
jgi:hypothetical protein